jgi:hypothetical protein
MRVRVVILAAALMLAPLSALDAPARADVLIGVAGLMTGSQAWFGEHLGSLVLSLP